MTRSTKTEPRNPELERAILADRDNPAPYLAYAKWLRERGDPRGELIALQEEATRAKGRAKAAAAFLDTHRARFLGEFSDVDRKVEEWSADEIGGDWRFDAEWKLGFLRRVRIEWPVFVEAAAQDACEESARAELEALLQLPSARLLEQLEVGRSPRDVDSRCEDLPTLIAKARLPLASLELVTSMGGDDDASDVMIAMPDDAAFASLERLTVRGGPLEIARAITFPALRELRVEARLGRDEIRKIARGKLPKLETLILRFAEGAKNDATFADFEPLLSHRALRRIDLVGCPFAKRVANAKTNIEEVVVRR